VLGVRWSVRDGARCRVFRAASFVLPWFTLLALFAAPAVAETVRSELTVVTRGGDRFPFQVEIADSVAEKTRGLMFREKLEKGHGMLFLYQPAREVSIWMKNTLLPLDIIFIDVGGRIIRIEPDAVPLSETRLRSGAEVRAVLEINGGLAGSRGIAAGDRVEYSPLWPEAVPR